MTVGAVSKASTVMITLSRIMINLSSVKVISNTYSPGSSLSHLDEAALSDYLMSPSIATAQTLRTVSDLEWAMMDDMGWQTVPEPATFLILAVGMIMLKPKAGKRR